MEDIIYELLSCVFRVQVEWASDVGHTLPGKQMLACKCAHELHLQSVTSVSETEIETKIVGVIFHEIHGK